MLKRIIIINLILIIFIVNVPLKKDVEQVVEVSATPVTEEEAIIISRSLEEPRLEEMEPRILEVTEISQEGLNFIKSFEGCLFKAKKLEGEKYYTIGYGHSGSDVKEGQTITQEQADRLFVADVQGYTDQVLKHCTYLELTQNELDALVSFTYNGGLGMLKKLTANGTRTKEEIAEHITAYTKSSSEVNRKGLLKRRNAEKDLFLNEV